MDLDFLLAEKAESDRRNSGPSCSTSKSSIQKFDNDSEDEEFEDSMVKERAGFISQIADDISAKLECEKPTEAEWLPCLEAVFFPQAANVPSSAPWLASKDLLNLLENNVLDTYILSKGELKEDLSKSLFQAISFSDSAILESLSLQTYSRLLSNSQRVKISWFPTKSDFMNIFNSYGYTEAQNVKQSSQVSETIIPNNIRSVIRLLTNCCKPRDQHNFFNGEDICSLLTAMARCLVERRLVPLTSVIQSCMEALVHCSPEGEWQMILSRAALNISEVGVHTVNSVYAIENIPMVNARSLELQRMASLFCLLETFGLKKQIAKNTAEEIISKFCMISGRQRPNYGKLWAQLKLADMAFDSLWQTNKEAMERFVQWLHLISTQIPASEISTLAPQARNWAAFMLQKYRFRLVGDDVEVMDLP